MIKIVFLFIIIVCSSAIFFFARRRSQITSNKVANIIERFVEGKSTDWEWDDFISVPIHDPRLEKIRKRCAQLDKEFPPNNAGEYTNEQGLDILKEFITLLR